MNSQPEKHHLDWLDYGRFFAAIWVLVFHYTYNSVKVDLDNSTTYFAPLAEIAKYGNLGVDFFFIISGYVIFYSAIGKSPGRFLGDRVVRLLPAFIVCMTITAIVRVAFGSPDFSVTAKQYFLNLTMIPGFFGEKPIDGVYWTLYREIIFYSWIFVLMIFGAQKRAQVILEIWITAIVIYLMLGKKFPGLSSHAILFASGCVIALIRQKGLTVRLALSLSVCWGVAVITAVERAAYVSAQHDNLYSPWIVAIITTTFFAAFLSLNSSRFSNIRLPAATAIGGLTYPLYLLHHTIGLIIMTEYSSYDSRWHWLTAVTLLMLAMSYLVMRFVERAPKRQYQKITSHYLERPVDAVIKSAQVMIFRPRERRVKSNHQLPPSQFTD